MTVEQFEKFHGIQIIIFLITVMQFIVVTIFAFIIGDVFSNLLYVIPIDFGLSFIIIVLNWIVGFIVKRRMLRGYKNVK